MATNFHNKRIELLAKCFVMQGLFELNKGDFTAVFPHLSDPFGADWEAQIDAADVFPSDTLLRLEQKLISHDRKLAHRAALNALDELAHYALLAFEKDFARRTAIVDRKYVGYSSVLKTLRALRVMNGLCELPDFKSPLMAKGYTQPQLDALLALHDDLDQKHIALIMFRAVRPLKTEQRRGMLQELKATMQRVRRCARIVYKNDFAKRKMFELGWGRGKKKSAVGSRQ